MLLSTVVFASNSGIQKWTLFFLYLQAGEFLDQLVVIIVDHPQKPYGILWPTKNDLGPHE